MMKVLGKRIKNGKTCYHVNDSLYHSFNCILMDGVSFEGNDGQVYALHDAKGNEYMVKDCEFSNCSLFGMTCDGADIISKSMKLPEQLEVGDWIAMGGMGAYTYGPRSTFNGMKSTTRIIPWEGQVAPKKSASRGADAEENLVPEIGIPSVSV
jgi:diaminopimelate decarboxylase